LLHLALGTPQVLPSLNERLFEPVPRMVECVPRLLVFDLAAGPS
jgi:hypothetical protein